MDYRGVAPLKVQQPNPAFAEGDSRWTNQDPDLVRRYLRKLIVLSFVTYWMGDAS